MKTYKTLFFGTPDFAVPVLSALTELPFIDLRAVFTQPDKPVGKKQTITPPPVKTFALGKNLTVHQPPSIKNKNGKFVGLIKKYEPDLAVIVAYGKIITKELLQIPKYGWLNIHASLLPKFRGASPIQAAILAGEEKSGVTLMQIDRGLDTGPIISQMEVQLSEKENAETLHERLSRLGGEIIKRDLEKYLDGGLAPQEQEKSTTHVTKTICKEDGRINWNNEAEYIGRQIRAYSPWPGTYTLWKGKRIKIIAATPKMVPKIIEPGTIFLHGDNVYVGAKKNALEIQTLQLAGKKPMDMKSFIKGHPGFIKAKLE